jgi:CheY-like chemotaxis protein/HPt (histidine-containing phosphotransfer) domain-containing protein
LAAKRLLLIEDNPTNQRIITLRATQWGMSLEVAANREEALEKLTRSNPFSALILDLQLPGTDGLALAEEIRREPAGRSVPLLLLTSSRLRADDQRPVDTAAAGYVHKPIRPEQLLDALCRALSIQRQLEKKAPATPTLDANLARRLPLRLLLADDNPINQKVGLSVLQKLGYRADAANNGLEVLKALEQKVYDILFLDVQMPEMDGLAATREICRRWPPEKRPAIVAMTGNALMGDRERCLEAGMDDYISKPVRIAEIQAALQHWGPLKKSSMTDTSFLARAKALGSESLLDHDIIAELRKLPPHDGLPMLRELIDLFLAGAPQHIDLLADSLQDAHQLAFHAHALKSMSLNLGAKRITELSDKLEELGRAGTLDPAPALLRELQAAFTHTKAQLLPLRSA